MTSKSFPLRSKSIILPLTVPDTFSLPPLINSPPVTVNSTKLDFKISISARLKSAFTAGFRAKLSRFLLTKVKVPC